MLLYIQSNTFAIVENYKKFEYLCKRRNQKYGELGVFNINNMIPTPIEELTGFRRKKLGAYELKKSTIKTVCKIMKHN